MDSHTVTWKQIPVQLAVHILIGTVMFIIIGLAALALHIFVDWLAINQLPKWMLTTGRLLEYLLYGIDILLFAVYLGRTALHHGRLILEMKAGG